MEDNASRKYLGIKCVNCKQVNVGPNRDLDNWQCGYCYSGFLSMKMLVNLVPREVLGQFNQKYRPKPGQVARPCPNCEAPMQFRSASLLSGKKVEVEMCVDCRLLWFDSGDLLRTLRSRKNEAMSKEDIISANNLNERMTDRAFRAEGVYQWATEDYFPRDTVALLAVAALMMPLAAHFSGLVEFLGFSPARPFHLFGATWLTSFFFHHHYWDFLSTGLWFLFLGMYTEQRLGRGNFLRLFVVAGLIARMQYLVGGTHRDPVFFGMKASVLALTAYAACTFPFRQVFFPTVNKWRSPRERVTVVLIIGGASVLFLAALDFILEAIRLWGDHSSGTNLLDKAIDNTLWGKAGKYLGDNLFRSHAAGFVTGLLWYVGQKVDSISDRRAAPR